ncbi:hypothetical protein RIF29_38634 [Crotalaria pallida]|uniref:Uncharacterized protein n=1 Tax=Crotalaria pallida TaxID=3830 RepID=A0AAN9E249_CROPI
MIRAKIKGKTICVEDDANVNNDLDILDPNHDADKPDTEVDKFLQVTVANSGAGEGQWTEVITSRKARLLGYQKEDSSPSNPNG